MIVKYPNFGIWSLLMIFEFVACLIVIPVSIATVQADIGGGLKTLSGLLAASSPLLISLVQYIASTLGGE